MKHIIKFFLIGVVIFCTSCEIVKDRMHFRSGTYKNGLLTEWTSEKFTGIYFGNKESGTLDFEIEFVQGLPVEGIYKIYDLDNRVWEELNSSNGISRRVLYSYHPNGKAHWTQSLKNGVKDGLWEEVYSNGVIDHSTIYKEGEVISEVRYHEETGELSIKSRFEDDLEEHCSYYLNGQLREKSGYGKDGQVSYEEYYQETGELISKSRYEGDLKEHYKYYPNGQLKYKSVFKNQDRVSYEAYYEDGTLKKYYENGRLKKK